MQKELTVEQKQEFHEWLQTFISESGHQFGFGFFFELYSGEVFYNGSDEYKKWYDGKLEEFKINEL